VKANGMTAKVICRINPSANTKLFFANASKKLLGVLAVFSSMEVICILQPVHVEEQQKKEEKARMPMSSPSITA